MASPTLTLNRWIVGLLAAICLVASAVIGIRTPSETLWWGGFLRVGIVLVALWFCLPTRSRPAAWTGFQPLTAAVLLGALLLALIRPRIGVPFVVLALLIRYVYLLVTRRG